MDNSNKKTQNIWLICVFFVFLCSCTVYTEKTSQALSRNVHAAYDSLQQARVDLAYYYCEQAARIVKEPKEKIKIAAIKQQDTSPQKTNKKETSAGPRVLVVPDIYRDDAVVVVGSKEYEELQKNEEISRQLEQDKTNLEFAIRATTEEIERQRVNEDKIRAEMNRLRSLINEKDVALSRQTRLVWVLSVGLGLLGYWSLKKFFRS